MSVLTFEKIAGFSAAYHADRANDLLSGAAAGNGIVSAAKSYRALRELPHAFSVSLPTTKVTDQMHSGRCWIFAACNLFRAGIVKKLNLEWLELSQTYLFFWDKLERSGFFLDNAVKTADLPLDDRLFQFLNQDPVQDGGQWDLLMNLVEKYGVLPAEAYPDNHSSKNSGAFRGYLTALLRQDALSLREMAQAGEGEKAIEAEKTRMLEEIYRLLCISLGEPPRKFSFVTKNKNGDTIREDDITPQDFYKKYVGLDPADYVSLINAPQETKPYYRSYTVEYLGNVAGSRGVTYVNAPMDVIRRCLVKQLADGEPVWFGSDCGKFALRDEGVFDRESLNIEGLLSVRFSMDKGRRLDLYDSLPNHAMLLQGVHLSPAGEPERWRIENSWGPDSGKDGFWVASDEWLGEYAYQFVINKKYVDETLLACLNETPVVLPAWDPMGTLAD